MRVVAVAVAGLLFLGAEHIELVERLVQRSNPSLNFMKLSVSNQSFAQDFPGRVGRSPFSVSDKVKSTNILSIIKKLDYPLIVDNRDYYFQTVSVTEVKPAQCDSE